jgi:predicted RNA-binding protein with RPS1 domain
MHVFTREVNEAVVIGDNIQVTVLEVGDDFVRLSVSTDGDEENAEEFVLAGPVTDVLDGFAVGRRMQLQF